MTRREFLTVGGFLLGEGAAFGFATKSGREYLKTFGHTAKIEKVENIQKDLENTQYVLKSSESLDLSQFEQATVDVDTTLSELNAGRNKSENAALGYGAVALTVGVASVAISLAAAHNSSEPYIFLNLLKSFV